MRRRALWGFGDQALSSLTNFGLAILVARSVSRHEFGGFALVLALYLLIGGVSQGLTSIPLSVRYSAADDDVFRARARSAVGTALVLGVVTGAGCVVVSFLVAQAVGRPLLALGLTLPALLLQDGWRFVFVAQGRPEQATLNDGLWCVLQVVGFAFIVATGHTSAFAWLLCWGLAAAAAALAGCLQFRVMPRVLETVAWLREHKGLAGRYAAEAVVVRGSSQVALLMVAVTAGLASVGSLRGAQVLFSPLNSLYLGGLFVAVPEGVRLLRRGRTEFLRFVQLVSVVTLLAAALWGLLVLLEPPALGKLLLGATWGSAKPLLLAVAAQYLLIASTMGPQVGLRAFAAAGSSLRAQLGYAVAVVIGSVLGSIHSAANGAATGIAIGTGIGALMWWRSYGVRVATERLTGGPRAEFGEAVKQPTDLKGSLGL